MTVSKGGEVAVRCQQFGYVLTKDIVPSYTKTVSNGLDVTTILTALLAYQTTERVTLGGVDAVLDYIIAISITNLDIWSACKLVQETVGGYLYVEVDSTDPTLRKLWLTEHTGTAKGQQIRLGKNLKGITHNVDYIDYCNRLYPFGTGVDLEDKTYIRVDATKSADAYYGYLELQGLYAAYKGWTGEGDALPANITVEAPDGAWVSPTGDITTTGWTNPAYGRDGNGGTFAIDYGWPMGAWTGWLEYSIGSVATTQVKWFNLGAWELYFTVAPVVQVEIYYGAAWHNVFNGRASSQIDQWVVTTFAQQTITGVRIRAQNPQYMGPPYPQNNSYWVYDLYIWDATGWTDYTANWEQGEDERTIRCAIGDYVAAAGYVISYTHALYLIDLDNITARSDIYSRQVTITTTDKDSLLAQGRVKLTESKDPITSIEVDMVDLSAEAGREWEELELGSTVTVIDEGLGVNTTAEIVRLAKPDLHRPEKIVIEVANKTPDIIDYIKG